MDRLAAFRWIGQCAAWLSHPYREYDRRRNIRLPANVEVTISVPLGTVNGRTVNVSRSGVSVLLQEPIACETTVFMRFPTIDRSAFANVRRCSGRGKEFEVALRFRDGLRLDDRTMADFQYQCARAPVAWNDPDAA